HPGRRRTGRHPGPRPRQVPDLRDRRPALARRLARPDRRLRPAHLVHRPPAGQAVAAPAPAGRCAQASRMPDQYRTVAPAGVHEAEINRSRFLCAVAPAATEQEAQDFIAAVRKEHADATHNCWAYVIGADASVQKANDDGEPGGTAGVPMLQMLLRREMRYVVAVVT